MYEEYGTTCTCEKIQGIIATLYISCTTPNIPQHVYCFNLGA